MNLLILDKIAAHAPKLSKLVESYRLRHEAHTRAAIVNATLASEARYLSRDEILYLAWLKADYDQRTREEDDALRQRWKNRQHQELRKLRGRAH